MITHDIFISVSRIDTEIYTLRSPAVHEAQPGQHGVLRAPREQPKDDAAGHAPPGGRRGGQEVRAAVPPGALGGQEGRAAGAGDPPVAAQI